MTAPSNDYSQITSFQTQHPQAYRELISQIEKPKISLKESTWSALLSHNLIDKDRTITNAFITSLKQHRASQQQSDKKFQRLDYSGPAVLTIILAVGWIAAFYFEGRTE